MRASLLLLVASGCARGVWNSRNYDCTGAPRLYIEAAELDVTTGEPDPGDACTLALRGLRGSSVDAEDDVLELYDVGEVVLLMQRARPPTELLWTVGADVDIDLGGLSVQLDTVDERGSGQILWQTEDDPVTVTIDTEGHLDQMQIVSRSDVTLHLPAGAYRLELEGGSVDAGNFVSDPAGPLVLVRTEGDIAVEDLD